MDVTSESCMQGWLPSFSITDKPSWAQVVRGSSNEGNIEKSLMVEGDFLGQHDKSAIGEPNYVGVNENVAGKIDTHGYSGVAEDIHFLGLAMTTLLEGESNVEIVEDQAELDKVGEKLSWEARVDALNGAFPSGVIECIVGRNDGCLDPMTNGSMIDLSKLQEMTCTKKGKKYGSLLSFQFERKKRDKALKKIKKKDKSFKISELEGRSLSDSYLKNCWAKHLESRFRG
ncbi:hypothetical protein GQ457_09G008940 [Hibiscus cannabinus]